jgi:hypothetical protein
VFIRYKNDTQHPSSSGPLNSSRNFNPAAICGKSVQPTKEDSCFFRIVDPEEDALIEI